MSKKNKNLKLNLRKNNSIMPYIIYKLNCNKPKNKIFFKETKAIKDDKTMGNVINFIEENGNKIYGKKILLNKQVGNLIYRSNDGMYGLWKNKLNDYIYLLLFVDYGEIKGELRKMGD